MKNENRLLLEAQIQALPSRQVQINGEIVIVKWDEEKSTIYLMKPDGSWSGRSSRYELPPEQEKLPQDATDSEDNNEASPTETNGENGENYKNDEVAPQENITQQILGIDGDGSLKTPKNKSPNKKIILGVVGIVAVAALIACIAFASRLVTPKPPCVSPTQPTVMTDASFQITTPVVDATDPNGATTVTEPVKDNVAFYALCSNAELYPGDILEESMFSSVALTNTEYQLLNSLHGLYADADIEYILGMKVQKYVSAGKYLAYEDLSRKFDPINPWITVSATKVMLPVNMNAQDIEKLLWGNEIQIEIEVKSQHTDPAGEENPEEDTTPTNPNGIDHNSSVVQSTVIDHYVVDKAVIVDLCDKDGKSLYEQYWAIALVPEIYQPKAMQTQYPTLEDTNRLLPLYLIVEVTQEQQRVIESILASQYESISIAVPAYTACCENDFQFAVYEKLRVAMVAVMDYVSTLDVAEETT